MKQLVISVLFIIFFLSCSNIQLMGGGANYSDEFLKKIESIQLIYKDGDKKNALQKLQAMSDETLSKAERAKKYNFLGVVYFSGGDLAKATDNFLIAKNYVDKDRNLSAQIHLNLASTYYKDNKYKKASETLNEVDVDFFSDKEKRKYHKLNLTLASQLDNPKSIVDSLIFLMRDMKRFEDVDDYQYKELLVDNYRKLGASERVHFLDKYQKDRKIVVAYLGKQEVLQRFHQGDRDGAQDVIEWLKSKFGAVEEVASFIEDYKFRVDNFSKINTGAVGVVLPLSSDKKASFFGKKAIAGVTTAVKELVGDNETVNLFLKDNKNNKYLARKMVQDLVMKHHVSVIIGGLFSDLAKEEYLEARKYGVMYISLSEVFVPRQDKGHLLLEIPGSVESQISMLLKPKSLEFFGKEMAIFYPFNDAGKNYVNEFWGHHNSGKVELNAINYYVPKDKKNKYIDYRAPVKQLLGLRFPRERKEELAVWQDIRKLEKSNFRIINELPPVKEFEWVFMPSIPPEAIQIIPTFPYFDAKNLKYVGGPSWVNKMLMDEQQNLGQIYAVGNDVSEVSSDFLKMYRSHNGFSPKLIDTRSYVAMTLVNQIIKGQNFSKREDLEKRIIDLKSVSGLATKWQLEDGLWLKDMDILKISKRGMRKLEL